MEIGHLKRSITVEMRIDLTGLVGAQNLRASFKRYQLGWMTCPKVIIARLQSKSFMFLTYPRSTWFLHERVAKLSSHT